MRIDDINSSQAVVILNLGEQKVTVSELSDKGYFLGTNFSYSLKKMVVAGYIMQTDSQFDKRSTIIELTKKGSRLHEKMSAFLAEHIDNFGIYELDDLDTLNAEMTKLENFWRDFVFAGQNSIKMNLSLSKRGYLKTVDEGKEFVEK